MLRYPLMREYFVYMLRCSDESYYIDVTNDYEKRVGKHTAGLDQTCYTFTRRPVALVHLEVFSEIGDAIAREKQMKRWNRKKKEALIAKKWEELPALAARRAKYQRKQS